jgi:hypothetical protein
MLLADRSILCRGRGTYNDLDAVAFDPDVEDSQSKAKTVFNMSAIDSNGSLADAMVAGLSMDGGVVLMYLNWNFALVAINATTGDVLARAEAPPVPAYTKINQVAGSVSEYLPLFITKIADTNYYWYYVYGGWGLSYTATDEIIFVSTFHKTFSFRSADRSFVELEGCSSGVSAMALSADSSSLFLARWSGIGYEFLIYHHSIADGTCLPYAWSGQAPTFLQIRSMAASTDGHTLYVAESLTWLNQLSETQVIKMVDLDTSAVAFFSSSAGSYLALDSVASIRSVAVGTATELWVLCAPGGWLGGVNGQTDVAWAVYRVRSGRVSVSKAAFVGNTASGSGGALAALDQSLVSVHSCSMFRNSASGSGGGVAVVGEAVVELSNSVLEGNLADFGGGVSTAASGRLVILSSNMSRNAATSCGGAMEVGGTMPVKMVERVIVSSNQAGVNGGGVCVNRRANESCAIDGGFMMSLSNGSIVHFRRNAGNGGGGALFDTCRNFARNSSARFVRVNQTKIVELYLGDGKLVFSGNVAGYGSEIATLPFRLVNADQSASSFYFPGQKLGWSLVVKDGYENSIFFLIFVIPC